MAGIGDEKMGNVFYFDWEVKLIEWLQRTAGPVVEGITKVLSFIGGETVMLAVLIGMLFCYKKEAGKRCALTVLTASMWFPMIKNVVLRIRPYIAHREQVKALSIVEKDAGVWDSLQQGFSFPSGHCATSVSLYGSIGRELRKRWMWFLAVALPLLIGLSRFIAGVHYPTDVLGGWAVGLLAIGFCMLLEKKVRNESLRYLILLAVTAPGIFWCSSRDYYSALGLMTGMAAAVPFEKKYVDYQDTRNVWAMLFRVAGAFALYYVLNTLLKMPFSKDWLNSGTLGANLVRTARYAIILFTAFGIYPKVFPVFEKIGR